MVQWRFRGKITHRGRKHAEERENEISSVFLAVCPFVRLEHAGDSLGPVFHRKLGL